MEKQQGAIKFNCTLLFRLIAPLYFAIYQLFKSISAIGAIKIRKKTPGGESLVQPTTFQPTGELLLFLRDVYIGNIARAF